MTSDMAACGNEFVGLKPASARHDLIEGPPAKFGGIWDSIA